MLGIIALILLILWITGSFALDVTNALIHILLVFAVIAAGVYVFQLIAGRRD